MNIKDLIHDGYFAKELPPPFRTNLLADKWDKVLRDFNSFVSGTAKKKTFSSSSCVNYSLPKVGYSRRLIGIPNPYHQLLLCKAIENNWSDITRLYNRVDVSYSIPIEDPVKKRAYIPSNTFGEFVTKRLLNSYDCKYELVTDISRFYPTVYTHIIPWVIHTKKVAKTNRSDSLYGNLLDRCVRNCNHGQTVGIPIGPDTSLIIAEIVSSGIDFELKSKFKAKKIKTFRYYDDYHIYVRSLNEAEEVLKYLNSILTDYQFDINEEKTNIRKVPHEFDTIWSIPLGTYTFRKEKQAKDLQKFASLAFRYQKMYPKDSVLKYAIKPLGGVDVEDDNWNLYESILFKFGVTEQVVISDVAEILLKNKSNVSIRKLRSFVETIVEDNVTMGRDYEVSWALWLCKEFNIKLSKNVAIKVFDSNDVVSILIALHLRSVNLIDKSISVENVKLELTSEALMGNKWLLVYEAINKGWIKKYKVINSNAFFKVLKKHKITFYDVDATLEKKTTVAKAETKKKPSIIAGLSSY